MTGLSYTASALADGEGRNGHVRTHDGLVDLALGIPKEIGGAGGEVSNPEMLFAAGYSGCFLSALGSVARVRKVRIPDAAVRALVTIAAGADGFGLTVELQVQLPSVDPDVGHELIEAAHAKCPYSKAIAGNVEVTLTLTPEASP